MRSSEPDDVVLRLGPDDDPRAVLKRHDDAAFDVVRADRCLAAASYALLAEVARVLRPAGTLVASYPDQAAASDGGLQETLFLLHAFFPDVEADADTAGGRVFTARRPDPRTVASRDAARVLVIDRNDRVLLLEGVADSGRHFWIAPGGGLEPGEGHAVAARREIREELGIDVDPGRAIWRRTHAYRGQGRVVEQTERYFMVRVDAFDAAPERVDGYVVGHRWWTLGEIEAATQTAFAPRRLAAFLAPLLAGRIPTYPIDVGP